MTSVSAISEPKITRFMINRTTKTVNYTVEGFGQIVKGAATPGTTPLRVMLQFLADYAPPDLETVPKCLAELQAYCDYAVEWEAESGTVFENGVVIIVPATEVEAVKWKGRGSVQEEQRNKLEWLKKQIGYGKYALLAGRTS
jgi:hypothetical protein